jgi:hypothetical protein
MPSPGFKEYWAPAAVFSVQKCFPNHIKLKSTREIYK